MKRVGLCDRQWGLVTAVRATAEQQLQRRDRQNADEEPFFEGAERDKRHNKPTVAVAPGSVAIVIEPVWRVEADVAVPTGA